MERNNRGQAALEFLLTYSWAILVVIVIIGALAYFGVLNPENFIPERCTLSAGITCDDFVYDSGEFQLQFTNGFGRSINITSITLTSATGLPGSNECSWEIPPTGGQVLSNGASNAFTLGTGDCTPVDGVGKLRGELEIQYTNVGSQIDTPRRVTGELFIDTQQ